MRKRLLVFVSAMMPMLLSGCIRGAFIDISGPIGAPSFSVRSGARWPIGKLVCLTNVSVKSGDETLWTIVSLPNAGASVSACRVLAKLDYGVLPAGFRATTPAKPLLPGRAYRISATGYGWVGDAKFTDYGKAYKVLKD